MSRDWPALDLRFPADGETTGLRNRTLAALDDWQPTALSEDATIWRAHFADPATRDRAAAALASAFASDGLVVSAVDESDQDWARRSQADLGPIRVGRILVRPSPPSASPASDPTARPSHAEAVIVIEPSMGFGTGHHATTRLCLALLQGIDLRGRTLLDIGCGSGILSIAADRLGAGRAHGIDSDPDAVASAERNLALNPAAARTTFTLADIRNAPPGRAEVIVANLTGAFLRRYAGALLPHLAPGGTCILSGILAEEEAEVRRAFGALSVVERRQENEWIGLRLERADGDRKRGARSEE